MITAAIAFIAALYFIICGLLGKGRGFKSKAGVPLTGREARAVRNIYLITGALLIIAGIIRIILR